MGPLDSPEEVSNRTTASIANPPAPPSAAAARTAPSGAAGNAADDGAELGPGPPFALVPSDRRTLLSLAAWPLGAIARLEDLVVEIPTPTSPGTSAPDLLPIERLRNRRGRLVAATLTTDLGRIARELERPGMRARLAAAGISDVRVGLADGAFHLVGRAAMGDREAAFTARAHLARSAPRPAPPTGAAGPSPVPEGSRMRLSIEDLRIYGFLPVPAPVVARAILSSLVQARPGTRWWIDFDPLEVALLETFAANGWRLPDAAGARLQAIELTSGRIALAWIGALDDGATDDAAPDAAAVADPPAGANGRAGAAGATAGERGSAELDEADGLLARGDHRGALDAYRRALGRCVRRPGGDARAGDPDLERRPPRRGRPPGG